MKTKDSTLVEARRLYVLGFAIHWLRPRSKIPVESGWTTGPRKTWEALEKSYIPGYNVGVRLGTPSKMSPSGYLAVVDVDVKSKNPRHKAEAIEAARKVLKGKTPGVLSGRGNGSRHYYCLSEIPFKTFDPAVSTEKVRVHMPSKKPSRAELETLTKEEIARGIRIAPAWGVSLYSEGRHVVLPPSIHPDSGEGYQWGRPLTAISELPLLPLKTAMEGIAVSDAALGVDESAPPKVATSLTGFKVTPVELAWLGISKELLKAITDGTGVENRSDYLLKASSALFSAGLSQNEVLTVLTDPTTFLGACAYEHAKTRNRQRAAEWVHRYTVQRVKAEREGKTLSGKSVFEGVPLPARKLSPEEIEKQSAELLEERNWRQDLDRNEKGRPRTTLKNLDLILTDVNENVFIEDLFASRTMYGAKTPWGGKDRHYIQDIDLIRVKRWLASTEFGIEPPTAAILEATSLLADRCQVHPVRAYLESLVWDKIPRINGWIKKYCNAHAAEPYLSEVSRKFLLAMVKRVFEPGCQWDYVPVLEGNQGEKKSSVARAIATDRWFADNLPDLRDKDAMLNLQGKWLVELGELADVKRHDYNLVKAYLVRRVDMVRPHYGRLKTDVPRQSVFIGTINEGQYLKDPTGNRRYWPIKVGRCDDVALTKVRDQLFAEAMYVYRTTNEILMLGPQAEAQARDAQEDRRIDDDETEMRDALLSFLRSPAAKTFPFEKFKVYDNLMIGPGAPWGAWNDKRGYILNTAGHILTTLGFEKFRSHGIRYWSRKNGCPLGAPSPSDGTRDFF